MPETEMEILEEHVAQEYEAGFVTDVESETLPPGLNEDVIRVISAKKGEPEWMLEWRLKAYRHWLTLQEPTWANIKYEPVDYQSISYYSAPKSKDDAPKSLDEIDPEIIRLSSPLTQGASCITKIRPYSLLAR